MGEMILIFRICRPIFIKYAKVVPADIAVLKGFYSVYNLIKFRFFKCYASKLFIDTEPCPNSSRPETESENLIWFSPLMPHEDEPPDKNDFSKSIKAFLTVNCFIIEGKSFAGIDRIRFELDIYDVCIENFPFNKLANVQAILKSINIKTSIKISGLSIYTAGYIKLETLT